MIRCSTNNDINGIITVWKEAFGDSENDINFFLNEYGGLSNILVCEIDNKIVSVLFLLEGNMKIHSVAYPSYYLYAACTLKNFSGRGYMTKLLEYAELLSKQRNKFFICLKPGEDSLFEFYKKRKYIPLFYKKTFYLNKIEAEEICHTFSNDESQTFDNKTSLERMRNKAFADIDYFEWSDRSINFALKANEHYGGSSIVTCKGYAIYTEYDNLLYVKEFAFTPSDFAEGLHILLKKTDFSNVKLSVPALYEMPSDGVTFVDSMILPLNSEAEELINMLRKPYLGLTLE